MNSLITEREITPALSWPHLDLPYPRPVLGKFRDPHIPYSSGKRELIGFSFFQILQYHCPADLSHGRLWLLDKIWLKQSGAKMNLLDIYIFIKHPTSYDQISPHWQWWWAMLSNVCDVALWRGWLLCNDLLPPARAIICMLMANGPLSSQLIRPGYHCCWSSPDNTISNCLSASDNRFRNIDLDAESPHWQLFKSVESVPLT